MSWPIGYAKQDQTYRARANGVVVVNGVDVTDTGGWIELPSPAAARAQGAPASVAVQLRPRLDIRGRTYLYLGAVRAEDRDYEGAHALRAPWAAAWLSVLPQLVHAEVAHRVSAATAFDGPTLRASGQYARHSTPGEGIDVVGARRRRTTGT